MKMKITILLLIFFVNLSFGSALNYLNYLRNKSGMHSLQYSKALSLAAQKHAKYLYFNKEYSHNENSYKKYFFATYPWQRVTKAGFATKAVVENISFYEKSYKASIDRIFATVYHRLAFLDTKIDTIGYANYKRVYVYDMSNSKLANLCRKSKSYSSNYVENICKNGNKLDVNSFKKAINSTKRANSKTIIYPFNNQKINRVSLEDEQPRFIYSSKRYGYPVTVTFNDYYYKSVKLLDFSLYKNNRKVKAKVVSFRNDKAGKLNKNQFVLLPLQRLQRKSTYQVKLKALLNGKVKTLNWRFFTN